MPRKRIDIPEEIQSFAAKMIENFNKSPGEGGWKGNDYWWYLSQLAIAVRELEDAMVKNSTNIEEKACNVANTAMIINDLYKPTLPTKKTRKKKK
jgi:hypothetical protein